MITRLIFLAAALRSDQTEKYLLNSNTLNFRRSLMNEGKEVLQIQA